jgi:hypothetical protein
VSAATEFREQYSFDVASSKIAGVINPSALETFVRLAGAFGGGNGRDLIENFAKRHPSDRIRFAAWRAKAAQAADLDGRIAVYEEAMACSEGQLVALARSEAARVQQGRDWLNAGPAPVVAAAS